MNANGLVVAIAGIWVLCQIFGGDALGRLGIINEPGGGPSSAAGGGGTAAGGNGGGGSW